MKHTRRSFLFALGAVFLGLTSLLTFMLPRRTRSIRRPSLPAIFENGCARYNIIPSGGAEFIRAIETLPPMARAHLLPWMGYGASLEESLVRGFLLSSQVSVIDGTRHATFQRLYDPYTAVCTNPYARLNAMNS